MLPEPTAPGLAGLAPWRRVIDPRRHLIIAADARSARCSTRLAGQARAGRRGVGGQGDIHRSETMPPATPSTAAARADAAIAAIAARLPPLPALRTVVARVRTVAGVGGAVAADAAGALARNRWSRDLPPVRRCH